MPQATIIELDRPRKLLFSAQDLGNAQNILTRLQANMGVHTRVTSQQLFESLWESDHLTMMVLLQIGLQRGDDASLRAEKIEEWYNDYFLQRDGKTPGDLMQLLVEGLQEAKILRKREGARPPASPTLTNG